MYSSEDLASFYFQYQTKALPHVKFVTILFSALT